VEAARILNTEKAMESQSINKLTTVAFCAFKIFGTSSDAIAVQSSSGF